MPESELTESQERLRAVSSKLIGTYANLAGREWCGAQLHATSVRREQHDLVDGAGEREINTIQFDFADGIKIVCELREYP